MAVSPLTLADGRCIATRVILLRRCSGAQQQKPAHGAPRNAVRGRGCIRSHPCTVPAAPACSRGLLRGLSWSLRDRDWRPCEKYVRVLRCCSLGKPTQSLEKHCPQFEANRVQRSPSPQQCSRPSGNRSEARWTSVPAARASSQAGRSQPGTLHPDPALQEPTRAGQSKRGRSYGGAQHVTLITRPSSRVWT